MIEIGFPIQPDFYFGPENDFTVRQWDTLCEPLYVPVIDHYAPPPGRGEVQFVLTRSLENSIGELVRYYADVLRLMEKHRKKVIKHRYFFELVPIIFAPGDKFELRYFTSEHWETATLLLHNLEQQRDGTLDDARDQGHDVEVVGWGDRLFIRVTDPDADPVIEHACVSCDRASLVRQIGPLRERTRRIRADLRRAFEVDYWSLEWLHRAWKIPHRDWMREVDTFL
ncbi:MAG TPA: hypothetical protein VGB24_08305 [Longimicrobium sp.]|jgi:hypothetical protein|uniref:hypothetical protein n=1 Tax=Longimicrobium sp. TaxID=2029185 RepID=UPI002ED99A59